MEILSPYIIAIFVAWMVGQGTKYVILVIKHRSFNHFRQLYISGNMPSAHTATVISVVTLIGLREGTETGLFGLAALVASIVMYDAVMVRRSSGEQGTAIQALIREQNSKVQLPRAAKGHTPIEVVVGALLGAAIGLVVFLATK
ncbi:MAG TPA: divergent PAP2 family protein [Candidatus Saccharimonadales bacterium]|nr:divergent PAP2 family protein [Candidatus Saccharimonadales bacterium]